jgi:hypothetical protein
MAELSAALERVDIVEDLNKLVITILRTVFVKMLKPLVTPLVFTLILNPSPKKGEGLQSGSPSPFLGEGAGG